MFGREGVGNVHSALSVNSCQVRNKIVRGTRSNSIKGGAIHESRILDSRQLFCMRRRGRFDMSDERTVCGASRIVCWVV